MYRSSEKARWNSSFSPRQNTAASSPRTPWCHWFRAGIFLGPSKSGKTVTLISLILEQYRGVFERIYIFSPSIDIDDGWIPVKKYIEQDLGVNTEREQAYWDEWDEAALRRIIQQQRKITEASKKLEMKKLYQVLIICDDLAGCASAPQTQRRPGHSLHQGSSYADQHLGQLAEATAHLSALLPKEQLYQLYEQATREPYSFLFVYYLKPRNEMFYKRFEERFALERDADGSGAQLPGPEAVRQFHTH